MKKILFLFSLVAALMAATPACAQKAQGTFEAGNGTFLLNGKPFIVKAAEVHYPRIPREYWEHSIGAQGVKFKRYGLIDRACGR